MTALDGHPEQAPIILSVNVPVSSSKDTNFTSPPSSSTVGLILLAMISLINWTVSESFGSSSFYYSELVTKVYILKHGQIRSVCCFTNNHWWRCKFMALSHSNLCPRFWKLTGSHWPKTLWWRPRFWTGTRLKEIRLRTVVRECPKNLCCPSHLFPMAQTSRS